MHARTFFLVRVARAKSCLAVVDACTGLVVYGGGGRGVSGGARSRNEVGGWMEVRVVFSCFILTPHPWLDWERGSFDSNHGRSYGERIKCLIITENNTHTGQGTGWMDGVGGGEASGGAASVLPGHTKTHAKLTCWASAWR